MASALYLQTVRVVVRLAPIYIAYCSDDNIGLYRIEGLLWKSSANCIVNW